ncbi:MAG: hypothetical protein IPK50_01445 [Fibrobacterota bacterium]|nr:MAG: hypothetical protein IPK50_01445 [Fibrobacterota bacterium]
MAKYCIFCGNPPQNKNKEHVIPRWLIALTGDPKRSFFLGLDWYTPEEKDRIKSFAFDQLTFPSCTVCNAAFSSLEEKAKEVMNKMLGNADLSGGEISLFFDWLDKVRIGLWLGMSQIHGNPANITPLFHIKKRMGLHDRMLILERTNYTEKRLLLAGIHTLSFMVTPSAFILVVNNLFITNISNQYLFSRRLGFPCLENVVRTGESLFKGNPSLGSERIMSPIIRRKIAENGIELYQPIFKALNPHVNTSDFETTFLKENCYDLSKGLGAIFQNFNGSYARVKSDEVISTTTGDIRSDDEQVFASLINILNWQISIDQGIAKFEQSIDIDAKKQMERNAKDSIRRNRNQIKAIKMMQNILMAQKLQRIQSVFGGNR